MPRGRPHRRTRAEVLAHATRCAVCGEAPTADNPLTLGHRIARANGGSLDLSNLEPQCRRCNLRIGARDSDGGLSLGQTTGDGHFRAPLLTENALFGESSMPRRGDPWGTGRPLRSFRTWGRPLSPSPDGQQCAAPASGPATGLPGEWPNGRVASRAETRLDPGGGCGRQGCCGVRNAAASPVSWAEEWAAFVADDPDDPEPPTIIIYCRSAPQPSLVTARR
jgi:hypothetical protein